MIINKYLPQFILAIPFMIALIIYPVAVLRANRRFNQWPVYRTVLWMSGNLFALISVIGPLANRAHIDFTVHMMGHLLLGMLAPLLMVLAAPMTLLLRALTVKNASRLSSILKSQPSRICSDPIVASLLNVGGLWLLYSTNLYSAMLHSQFLHVLIHIHVFIAGYLFTISMIYIDPIHHRRSYIYRAIVFIIALAGHQILSKYIYAHPPQGVSSIQAESGGMFMYYGGDVIDIVIIIILCSQWFKSSRPRTSKLMKQQGLL